MSIKITPLSVTQINAAKPKEKRYKLSDGEGLQLWVYPTGVKSWRYEWTRADKKKDCVTLGEYPAFGLADARKKKDELRGWVKAGFNPKIEIKRRKKRAIDETFKAVALQWLDRWQEGKAPRYAQQMRQALERDVFPSLEHYPIADITARMIVDALAPVETRGALDSASRIRAMVEKIFSFAFSRGLIDNNQAAGTKGAFRPPPKQHFRALPPDQLPALVAAFCSDQLKYTTRMVGLWQLLTLARPGEAVATRWDEIDRSAALWTIPAEKMKMRRDHIVPLSKEALSILDLMEPISGLFPYVFPGRAHRIRPGETGHTSREVVRMACRRFDLDSTAHGFRALASTAMNETGLFSPDVIEAALAHEEKNKTRAAYNRAQYLDQRQKLLAWWGGEVSKAGLILKQPLAPGQNLFLGPET